MAAHYTAALRAAHPGLVAGVDVLDSPVPAPAEASIYHVVSPFEDLPIAQVWPVWARSPRHALVVTLHDLIPLLFADQYIPHSGAKLNYMTRLGLVRRADVVLTISRATARDAVTWLGLDPARVRVVYEDCDPAFGPTSQPAEQVLANLQVRLPRLRAGFCLYVASEDWRKNLERTLEAFSRLDPDLRGGHQLVIACQLSERTQGRLLALAARLGIADDVLLTGAVSDSELKGLYQACRLFTFPSLYEGFGLPPLEAMRCGAPVIAADNSSLPELVDWPEARFDARDIEAMAAVMVRGLTDEGYRSRLFEMGRRMAPQFSWRRTVELSLPGYRRAGLSRRAA